MNQRFGEQARSHRCDVQSAEGEGVLDDRVDIERVRCADRVPVK